MPLPKKNPGESTRDFLSRCMGNDTMNEDFPDVSQRFAVCRQQAGLRPGERAWVNLAGLWAILPQWLHTHLALMGNAPVEAAVRRNDTLFARAGNIAVVPISGPITKHMSFFSMLFGGTSTEMVKRAIIDAATDESVSAIMLHIDSPGGQVAGVQSLADTIHQTRSIKPIHAHIEDLGASAAIWIASQANRITANATAEIGSIGTMAVLEDISVHAEQQGVKVHVITSQGAENKAIGVPGASITDDNLATIQTRVDEMNEFFIRSLARGRNMLIKTARERANGELHLAARAKGLGLIDEVLPGEEAIAQLDARMQHRRKRERHAQVLQDYTARVERRKVETS